MANKKIQATATLFLDTKDAQNDAKKFVNDLKQKLSEVETAADKMTVFKDMVAYIAQVDRALAALRKNNKDAFNSMFDGLDSNLKQQLEGLFGVNGAQLGQVEVLREKLNTLTLKSSIKEIRTFAKEINALFTSIGVSAPFDNIDEQFSGRTNTGHIQALATSLANFATVWEDLSARVSQGFGGAGGFGSGVFGGLNKEVQEEIDKLKKQKEELQEVIDSINQKPLQLKLTKKNDTSELKRLLGEYNDVKSKMDSSDYNNLSFEEQNKILAERIRLANLLKQANEHIVIQDKGSMDAYDIASIGAGQSTIADAQTFLENFYKDSKGKAEELRKLYIDLVSDIDSRLRTLQGSSTSHDIEDTVSLYDKLNKKIREYFELKKQLNNIEEGSVEYNNIQDRQRAIQSEILTLKQLSEAQEDSLYGIFDDIDETDVPFKNALTNICSTLEVEIPQATNQAGEQIDTFGKKIVDVSEYVSALSGQLKEMFAAAGRSANFEYHIAIDGLDIKARHGSEKSVDLATQTETYLDTLFSDSVLYGHSHRGGTSATNIYDIETVLSSYRDGVSIPVHFVVGKDSITTMDFTGLSKDMANQLMQEIAATNSNKNAPVINESINKIVEKFTGNSGALKTWNVEQFDDLAKYIYDVSSAASSALTPIEKFQAVLDNMFGKGKVDATKYESLLSGLDKNNVKNIFNQIASIENLQPIKTTDMLTMGQVNAEIDESIAKYKTLREEANLSYADIRNEVDKVIEHYNAGGSATSGLDFFQKYFPEGEWQNVRNLLTDAYDNLISIEEVTNRIAGEFGVDPDTFAQIPNGVQTSQIVDETNQKLREQEQLWENVKIAIKNGIGEVVSIDDMAIALEVIEGEIKEGILTSLEECIARFKEFNNISEEGSLEFVGKRERVIEDRYDTYLSGEDEVVSKEEADKLRQLSVQQEQLYQNLRSAIKGTLSDIVDVDDMTYAFDTLEKEIEAGLLTTLDQCIEKFKLLTGLDDKRLASIKDDQRVADSWDYYQGNRYVDDGETVIDSSEYNQLREDLADERDRTNQYAGDAAVAEDRADQAEARAAEAEARVLEVESDALRYQEAANRLLEEKSALQRENDELREQLSTQIDADHKSQLAQAEVAQLELLQQKLLEVKTAVDAKTQAFEEEYVTVDGVVDAEITSLQSLIAQLQEVVAQINLINDGFNNINTNAPKVELKSAPVEQSVAAENTHYVTDPQGRPVNAYRGIEGAYSGLVSNRYHGGTFWTTNIELAKEYAGEIGKVEKSLLSMKNPMEIDGQGAYWNQIEYIGDNSDETSQKLHQLNATIKQTETILEHLKTIQPTEKELKDLSRGFISETKNDREIREYTEALEKAKAERDAIFADTSNPYGKKNTNELVEIAKSKGYDGVIFKDIIDSATGSVTDLSTVMVTFEQNQIHYIETISSTFESAVTSLKNHFGDLTQHISASSEEVESSIRKMVELRGKVNAGEISEDEYNAFISQNAIARDYGKLAKKSRAVPDFITGALDGNEFELKHVIESINGMLDNMRERMQNIAKAFGKEGVPLDQLLADSTNVAPITESSVDEANITDEVEQLNKLQTMLTEVKNAILAKTKAFVDEGDVVGQVVGKEVSALMKLAETVDSIVPKVNSLSTKMASIGPIDFVVKKDSGVAESGTTTEDKFKTRVDAKKGSMTKYINDLKDVQYVTDDTRDKLVGFRDALDTVKTPKDLNDIIAKFEKLQTEIGILKTSFEKTGLNDIQNAERSLLGSFNTLSIDQKRGLEPERDEVIKQLETYKNTVLNGQKVELQAIEDTVRALREKIEVYKQANKEANNAGSAQKKNSKFGDTVSRNATAKYNSLMGSANSDQFANSKEVSAIVGEYEKAYKAMIAFRNELRSSDGIVSEADEAEFKRLTIECNEYAKALDKLIKSTMKLKGNKANPNDYMLGSDFVDNAQGRKQALTDFVKSVYDIDVAAEDFRKDWNEVVFAVDNGDGTFTHMTAKLTDARNEIVALAGDTNKIQGKFESFIDGVKNRLQSLSQYFIATVGIYDVWNVIKQGINHVREIDTALTELKKVTNETDASYNKFLQDMSKTGSVIGATVKDLTTMAADWSRLGYSMEEAGKLAESTAVLLNVSEFKDATEASEALISTMQAFQYTADESEHVVDILNEVGNNYAVSSDGIAVALQDSASALMEAGNNLEQSVALVAAANKVVQDPNSVGSALRTISLRLRGTSVEVLEEMGEETDGVVESISKMQGKIRALTGVNILTDSGAYKETYQILYEIGQVWKDMNDIDQAALLELMAGKNRANTLAAILGNMEDLEGAYNDALNAEGSALRENEAYLDSIQGKIDLFNNSLQTMWMNFIDSKTVKNIVSLGTALIKLVDAIGLIPTGVGLFAGWKFAAAELEKAFGKTNVSTKELKKNINDYINQQKVAGQTATATAQEVVVAEQQKTAAQTQATAAGAAEEAQDKKNITTDLAGSAADKVKAESQKEENQTQIDGVAAGKAEENQDKKNIATDLTGAGADVGAGLNVKDITKAGSSTVGVLGKIGTGIKAVGIALGKAAIVMLAVKAATWAIGKAWEALDKNVIHRAEHIKEEVKSLQDSYESMKETLDSNLKILTTSSDTNVYKTLEDEFTELTKGVDQYGNNLSLTAEQYERYKSICEDIVSINPYLASGYDSATAAIGNQADALSHLIDLYKEQAKYEAQQFTSDENLAKVYENAKNEYQEVLGKKEDVSFNAEDAARTAQYIMDSITGTWNDTEKQFTSSALGINGVLDALGLTDIDTTDVVGFGSTLDALTYIIANHSDQFIEALNNASDGTTKAYDDYVLTLDGSKISAASIALQGAANNYQTNVDAASKKVETANDGLIYTLSQLFTASSEYDDLNDASKSFLANWLRNSDLFKVDSNLSIVEMKDKINDMITNLSVNVDAQKILDNIFTIDASKVDYEKYKVQISDLIDQFWMAIGGDSNQLGFKNKQDLAIQLGFNFTFDRSGGPGQTDEGSLVRDLSRVVGENITDVQKWIDSQPAATVQALMKIDWTAEAGLTYDEVLEKIRATVPNEVISVETYSVLVSEIESYNDILSQTSEIVSDNTEVTQEYKDSLTALGISEEELSECFDENNSLIVKNAAALRKLVAQKKKDKQATVQQAKSMSQLQYKNTVQQLQQVVKAMAVEVRASGLVSSAALKTSASLREQIEALKQTIQQYALLEISLSDAANAYSEFEAAKERDAQLTYGDSMIEMLQTINEGFKTGQVGTEAFQYAVKVIVPESEYAHIDNIEQRMIAIHDYIDKNPLFADWFTIDEGEFSITLDNINSFIDDAFGAGLFTNDSSGDFFLTEAIKNAQDPLKEFADQLGKAFNTEVTEGSVLAMLSELEKYDASWGNILTDLTTTPIDRAINDATTALEEALTAQEEFIRSGGDLNSDKYIELEDAVSAARGALDKASQAAIDNAQTYTQVEAVLRGMTGEVKYTQEQADALARSLGLINENGHIQIDTETGALILTQEQLDALNERLIGLAEPTILDVQLAYDEIDRQLQELNAYLSDPSNYGGTILTELNITNEGEAKAKVDELTADRDAIQLVYNITTTSTEEAGTFEKLTTWEANGVQIVISGDASAFDATVSTVNAVEMEEKDVIITADPTEANTNIDSVDNNNIDDKKPGIYMQGVSVALNDIYSIDDALDALPFTKDVYVNVHYREDGAVRVNGTAHVDGTAYSNGNWGVPRTEVALTGELGPEMVVRDGRWFTVGENGAEFTQIKKGDIIFNHKQTEDLLSKGYVTSRGKAYASGTIPNTNSGTAYYKTFGGYVGDNDVFENGSANWMDPWTNSFDDAADDLSDAADSMSDAADDSEQIVDFIEMKLEEIEAIIEKTSARISNFLDDTTSINSKDELYDELVKAEKDKAEVYLKAAQKYDVQAAAALSGVPQQYQAMARNGAIAIEEFLGEDQVEIAEKIQEYRDWAAKADEAENGHLEAIAAISAHRVEQLEDIATDFENIVSISKSHSDLLQAEMDFIEESGNRLSESYYEDLKKHSQKQLNDMQNERVALQKILDDAVAAGDVIIGSDDWYSMLETIYEVDQEIIDCKTRLEEFQNAINELYWDSFDKLIAEIDSVNSELSNLYDLVSDDDSIVDGMGNWTADGYTALGLLVQQMEVAQQKSKEYGNAISKLKKDYKNGLYSTDEYNEKLAELTDGQYDAIKSYEDAKDAIIDLNKTRVDAVKDGIEKEIEAYEELISKKKESLDADKDARDFERSVEESNKSISDVERKIASLKGNTSSSAIAERRRLEEELRKLQQEREDIFYDESVENQQKALDKELENFKDAKNKEIEDLEEYLKNQEKVLQDSFAIVQENTQQIVGKLVEITEDYGVTISDTVATPWVKGTNAIGTYEEQLNTSVSATTKNLEILKQQLKDLEAQADKTANSVINSTHSSIVTANDGHQTSIKGYAKGSKSVEYDQWALIDELGDELQITPDGSGRLAYIKKGTGILNNTLTERLMDLAMDPTSMIENSRPVIGTPGITTTNNTITVDASVGTLLHVEHLDGSNPAEVTKLVDKAWEKKMQTLNSSIKKFTR